MSKKVVSQTPIRFSVAAGGNDLDAYWLSGFVGATVSLTIDKYVRIIVKSSQDWSFSVPDNLTRAAVSALYHQSQPLAISIKTDLPPGAGLGTGGAIMVGLVNAITHFMGESWNKAKIAETAYQIERHDLGLSCGKKDQYSTAFGGLNLIKYYPDGRVMMIPIETDLVLLREHLLLFDTGMTRDSERILKDQQKISQDEILKELHILNQGALDIAETLLAKDFPKVGRLMYEHWQIKRRIIPGISNEVIDTAYERAIEAGALGGRISGAGGGGYLIIFCPPEKREVVCQSVRLTSQEFNFENKGTTIIEAE